jgi:hypothetical protein
MPARGQHLLSAKSKAPGKWSEWEVLGQSINRFDWLIAKQERIQMTVYNGLERRSGKDRRKGQFSALKKLFSKGSRESMRRAEDRNSFVVFDRYKKSLVVAILIVLSLSLVDALLTLILISHGANEFNPVMQYYLNCGTDEFVLVKFGLTLFPLLIILFAKEALITRYHINVSIFFHLFAAFFVLVIVWEIYLLSILI